MAILKSRLAVVKTTYTNVPVDISESFLAPLPGPSTIKVSRVKFGNTPLAAYADLYAVVLDDVLSQDECDELILMAEKSVGAHGQEESGPENNGWQPARVNAGGGYEILDAKYRNSDRIIWDEKTVAQRLWKRILQGEGMAEYFSVLDGEEYAPIVGNTPAENDRRWTITAQGMNERMRFLKYGPGQFFKGKPHIRPDEP